MIWKSAFIESTKQPAIKVKTDLPISDSNTGVDQSFAIETKTSEKTSNTSSKRRKKA
jgi:hypothetical protein